MATEPLRAEPAANNSPNVAAFLRAFDLQREHENSGPDDPDAQFAWAAMQGAEERVLDCAIDSLDHVAAAALLVFAQIAAVLDGYALSIDGQQMVPVEDARRELRTTKEALKHIWEYAARNAADPSGRLEAFARYCGAVERLSREARS